MKKLTRSNDKMIAGVLAGIAEYFDIDPTIIRLIFVFLAVFTACFPALLTYILFWIIMPEKSHKTKESVSHETPNHEI
jgi:phage shock protein C